MSPRLVNLVLFRTLSKAYHVDSVVVDGKFGKIAGSPLDLAIFGEYLTTQDYSPRILGLILNFFNDRGNQGTFIDIGAHVGLVTIPIAGTGAIECYAFEPDTRNLEFLERNIRSCKVENNTRVHDIALFDQATTVDFEISDWHHGDHRIRITHGENDGSAPQSPFKENSRHVVKVKTERLDEIMDAKVLKEPIVAKLDTQGSECQIIKGGQEVLSRADMIICEYCPYMIRRVGGNEEEFLIFAAKYFSRGAIMTKYDRFEEIDFEDIADVISYLRLFSQKAKLDFVDVVLMK